MTAELKITDGTTEISLIRDNGNAFHLNRWRPGIAQFTGGGTWQQSALSDGRRLVDYRRDNVIETFDLKIADVGVDELIWQTQELRRLLDKAADYWATNWQDVPVYLMAKADCEENPRHATIYAWSTPEDENPFAQPFQQSRGAMMNSWTLSMERGHWTEHPPGTGTCVETSGEQVFYGATSSTFFVPTATLDDAYIDTGNATLTNDTNLYLGRSALGYYHFGVRFRNVTIPQGAIIISAVIQLVCDLTANAGVVARVYAEDDVAPAQYGTYANLIGRALTSNSTLWSLPATMTEGIVYDTPDLALAVQEITDQVGWASGQDMAFQLRALGRTDADVVSSYRFASWDDLIKTEPILRVTWLDASSPATYGRSATCSDEVYLCNKANYAQIGYVEIDDGGIFQGNLIPGGPPYDLLPAAPLANDAVYFGCPSSDPFCSLVFDLSTGQVGCELIWEYWNSAWVTLWVRDNTRLAGGIPLTTTGVCSVHWEQPSDWVANDPGNGVTTLWVRARVTAVKGATTPPTQQTRDVYTILWPRIDVDSAQVGGDLAALARSLITDQSSAAHPNTSLKAYRIIAGLRTLSRGTDFVAYLNAAAEQNPAGAITDVGTDTIFTTTDVTTPTGTRATYSPAALNAWNDILTFTFNASLASDFYGTFHIFLRAKQVGGAAGDIGLRLKTFIGSTEVLQSDSMYFDSLNPWQIIDFGQIRFPGVTIRAADVATSSGFIIQGWSSSATPDAYLYDLVLIPTDEWAVDSAATSEASLDGISDGLFLDMDSIGSRGLIDAMTFDAVNTRLQSVWLPLANGPAIFQENVDQRLWFFSMELASDGSPELRAPPYHGFSLQAFRNQRYLSMRGER